MAPSLTERFETRVDRSGEHHLWLGAKKENGTGVLKVDGRMVTAHRAAWELAHGALSGQSKVFGCPDEPACVRVDHLRIFDAAISPVAAVTKARGRRGGGSMRLVSPGVWELAVVAGYYPDGKPRRLHRRVQASDTTAAAGELAAFVTEIRGGPPAANRELRQLSMDQALEVFLTEHLRKEKGREERTLDDYRGLHKRWFSPHLGRRRVRDVDRAALDRIFGMMREAGLSRSTLNQAKSLYAPFFRWAKHRQIITRNPMLEFEMPTSSYVSHERTPPEVEELSLLLNEALVVIPDVAPVLALGAVTGMRRGELVGIRRSRVIWHENRITVDLAVDEARRIKSTKTRRERSVHVDAETMEMLLRHCQLMDERAAACDTEVGPDAFVFSLEPDCSKPLHPDFVTKRVGLLKDHLGIAEKSPETIALEDEALRLFRQPRIPRPPGSRGLPPKGALPFTEIGRRLGRSNRWAVLAIKSAERREAAKARGIPLNFDGSILASRKFTSSELLDAGFNISAVAQRQGHGPQVLMEHYAKSRRSADRKAAEHLGRVVHGRPTS